jgi:hypothetical protein
MHYLKKSFSPLKRSHFLIIGTKYNEEKTDQNVKIRFQNILQNNFLQTEILYMARINFKNLFQNHSSLDVRPQYCIATCVLSSIPRRNLYYNTHTSVV